MLLALFAVFYFFMIRPQQKKQKETQNMLSQLGKGDKIVTIGGIVGTIVNIKKKEDEKESEDIIVLKTSDTTKIEMVRSSIARVISRQNEAVSKS
ncbi:preprotein translocase subunit YajC [bacterium]|nr:preprotein translocase subunit YajC [bacterium]